jgi:DNA-binding response OmpR family regulator
MLRLAIFSNQPIDFSSWSTWLEKDFEIAHVTQLESLSAVLSSWGPHVLIFCDKSTDMGLVANMVSNRRLRSPLGWIVISKSYDLREELKTFEHGADHYLLFKTPTESIRARLINLARRSANASKTTMPSNLVQLPKNRETLGIPAVGLALAHGVLKVRGEVRKVTPTQYRLIEALVSHANSPLTREWIRDNVFRKSNLSLRSIDAQVAKLKKAIPELRTLIVNLYGNGYILKVAEQKASA